MEPFDLIEYQQKARETCDPKKLYELWEDICLRYERKEIGTYEVEEMKEVILPSLKQLANLRCLVNGGTMLKEKLPKLAKRRKTG
jgi:hypothetical protein